MTFSRKNSPGLWPNGVLELSPIDHCLLIYNPIDHDLRIFPGSPGSPNVSPWPPLDAQPTSTRPPVDRCQAILGDFLAPLGAKWPKCDFDDPYTVLCSFCSPRGAQVAPLGCLCGSRAPLGAPSGPSRVSLFRSQRHFGRQTCQSVILSTPPMVFNGFCNPKGCPRGVPFCSSWGSRGAPGHPK